MGVALLLMMGMFLAAVVAVVVRGRRTPGTLSPLLRLASGAGGLVVLLFFGWTLTMHMCGAGFPVRQCWLAWLSWLAAAAVLAHPRPLALSFGLCLVGLLALGWTYDAVVHRRDYTGSPRWVAFTARPGEQATVVRLWHTSVTGLYAVRRSGP